MANRRTEKPVPGFRGRSGRNFQAKLKLVQNEDGKWRVEFDEEWATAQPPPEPESNGVEAPADGAAPQSESPSDGGRRTRARARVRN